MDFHLKRQRAVLVIDLWKVSTPAKLSAVRNALVLLSLLPRVDIWAWDHVLGEHCGVDTSRSYETIEYNGLQGMTTRSISGNLGRTLVLWPRR
jgi:hypothetical protein